MLVSIEKIEYLKKKGVRINARDLDGNTVLHNILTEMIGMFDDNASVKLLINCGANVNAQNNKKETPLHVSVKNENTSLEIVHTLLKAGAEVNSRTYQGKTALHYLIPQWYDYDGDDARVRANRFKALIDLLISKGLDINSIDNKGDTPLHTIARRFSEQKEAINFLVKKGANPNIKNYDGKTPLELAKEKQSPNTQFFEKLINH